MRSARFSPPGGIQEPLLSRAEELAEAALLDSVSLGIQNDVMALETEPEMPNRKFNLRNSKKRDAKESLEKVGFAKNIEEYGITEYYVIN